MSHRHVLVALGALVALAGRPLAAQAVVAPAPNPAVAPDSAPRTLAKVVVTAQPARRPRTTSALLRENAKLRRVLAWQDRRIAELRTRIDSVKAVGAAREREIVALDSTTADVRAQRLALEERLRETAIHTAAKN